MTFPPCSPRRVTAYFGGTFSSVCVFAFGCLLTMPAMSQASLVVTYAEDAQAYHSTLSGTSVLTFDSFAAATKLTDYLWMRDQEIVGTIDHVYVSGADVYGGAGSSGSNYAVQSQGVGGSLATPTTTISFAQDHAYFGFWWSAGDAANVLTFYSDDEMVAEFTTNTLLRKIATDSDYYGNPHMGGNWGEPYAFINFFGQNGTTWNRVMMSNLGGSGFESDNWTDRVESWGSLPGESGDVPGVKVAQVSGSTVTVVPEPGISVMLGAAGILLMLRRRRAR